MKWIVAVLVVLVGAAAHAGEPCKAEMSAYDRALDRSAAAQRALKEFDSSPLAPLDPQAAEKAEKQRQQLLDNIEAARADVNRASDAHDTCMKKRLCKKWKGGWSCTIAWTYEKCCLDKSTKSNDDKKNGSKK